MACNILTLDSYSSWNILFYFSTANGFGNSGEANLCEWRKIKNGDVSSHWRISTSRDNLVDWHSTTVSTTDSKHFSFSSNSRLEEIFSYHQNSAIPNICPNSFNLGSFSIFHTPASQFSQKSSWSKYNLLYSWRFLQLITKIILITVGYCGEGTPTDALFFPLLIKSYRVFQYLHQQQEIILMININLLEKRISRSSN